MDTGDRTLPFQQTHATCLTASRIFPRVAGKRNCSSALLGGWKVVRTLRNHVSMQNPFAKTRVYFVILLNSFTFLFLNVNIVTKHNMLHLYIFKKLYKWNYMPAICFNRLQQRKGGKRVDATRLVTVNNSWSCKMGIQSLLLTILTTFANIWKCT